MALASGDDVLCYLHIVFGTLIHISNTMKKYFLFAGLTVSTFFIFSFTAFAQATAQDAASGFNTLAGLITIFTNTIVRATATLLLSAGVVAFFFGVVQYIWGLREGDTKKVENGNQFMIWGLVGLFVMFSVYGIIKFGQGILFNGRDVTSITIPDINLKGGSSGPSTPNTNTGGDPFAPTPNTNTGSVPSTPNTNTNGGGNAPTPNTNTGGSQGSSYQCTPRYECTLPNGGGIGLCNESGNACLPAGSTEDLGCTVDQGC